MDFKEVMKLIETVNSSDISFFEININDVHIKMDKSLNRQIINNYSKDVDVQDSFEDLEENLACTTLETDVEEEQKTSLNEPDDLKIIYSPMVGTFYSAPSEKSDDFINCGDKVKKGDVLCIIEAMKLMNEIESESDGIIKEILVNNGEMVEYGQPIFKIQEV